jgi:hypothetical protein
MHTICRTSLGVAAALLLTSCIARLPSAGGSPPTPAADFGFRFEDRSCFNEVLDTFAGTYSIRIDINPPESVTIPLQLAAGQMRAIHTMMNEIDFFAYPDVFAIAVPDNELREVRVPANRYHILVRDAGREKTVDWLDEIVSPTSPDADRLRDLFSMIKGILRSMPEVQNLPKPRYACA